MIIRRVLVVSSFPIGKKETKNLGKSCKDIPKNSFVTYCFYNMLRILRARMRVP